ncbi:hypothetical protein U0070_010556 [Myodes glareolus]
MSGRTTP